MKMKNITIENERHEMEIWEHTKGVTIESYDKENDKYISGLLSFDDITKIRDFMNDILNQR